VVLQRIPRPPAVIGELRRPDYAGGGARESTAWSDRVPYAAERGRAHRILRAL